MSCTFIQGKESIILDENLKSLGSSFVSTITETNELSNIQNFNHIATIKIKENNFVNLTFIISSEELHKISYQNNLDSLIDYETFTAPIYVIFGLLECIRKYYNSTTYIVNGDVYMKTVS